MIGTTILARFSLFSFRSTSILKAELQKIVMPKQHKPFTCFPYRFGEKTEKEGHEHKPVVL
ncbi:hypothetical protein Leryth_004248 [Lithospermum erythrorhizon]|nr:hypothetical protein Leryth_004248 [Lithospermum erythrorhizon]